MCKRLKRAARSLAILAICVAALFILGAAVPWPLSASGPVVRSAQSAITENEPNRQILVLSNGIHTDIALRVDRDIAEKFAFAANDGLVLDAPGVEWLMIGRGGRRFYTETPQWSDLRAGAVWASLTRDRAVMHIQRTGTIDTTHPSVMPLTIPAKAYDRLVANVLASFATDDAGGRSVLPGASYGADDLFYEANGWFNAVLGCNVWTGQMLRQAGQRVGIWTPIPASLFLSLKLHNS